MRGAIAEVGRVLSKTGTAVYVVGENTLRGSYIRTSVIVTKLAELAGLSLKQKLKKNAAGESSLHAPAVRRYRGNERPDAVRSRSQLCTLITEAVVS
jgi:hypothetical protein